MARIFPTDQGGCWALLRPSVESDLVLIADLEEEIGSAAGGPWTIAEHRDAPDRLDGAHFIVAANGQDVGFVLLGGKSNPDGSVELQRLLVRGRQANLYQMAVVATMDQCFSKWFVDRLWVDPATCDSNLLSALRASGFAVEGPYDSSKEVTRSDCVLSIFSSVYERNWKPYQTPGENFVSRSVSHRDSLSEVSNVLSLWLRRTR